MQDNNHFCYRTKGLWVKYHFTLPKTLLINLKRNAFFLTYK